MNTKKQLVINFLKHLHNLRTCDGKTAAEAAYETNLPDDLYNLLVEKGWIEFKSFGLPEYKVADIILKKLNIN